MPTFPPPSEDRLGAMKLDFPSATGLPDVPVSRRLGLRQAAGRLVGSAEPRLSPLSPLLRESAAAARALVSESRLRRDVEALAEPRSRRFAAVEMEQAEAFVAATFREAGWKTESQPFVFTDVVGLYDPPEEAPGDWHVTYDRLEGANVLARRAGKRGRRAFLVGAHLDTVHGSPGADDNASGVAAVLELARMLGRWAFEDDLLLAAFDMEELGGFGARALGARLAHELDLAGVIVFESIGYTSTAPASQSLPPAIGVLYPAQVGRIRRRGRTGDWTLVIFRESSRPIACAVAESLAAVAGREAVIAVRDPVDLPVGGLVGRVAPWVGDFARSDHSEFWKLGVPAIQVTDTANFRNPNYHRPTDTPETLDYARIADVVAATATALVGLAHGAS